jgi:hypothetical protein
MVADGDLPPPASSSSGPRDMSCVFILKNVPGETLAYGRRMDIDES